MHKTIAKVGILGLVVFGLTECHKIESSSAFYETKQFTQKLEINNIDFINNMIPEREFARGSYEIITTMPWLKPENQSLMLSDDELIEILKSVGFEGSGLRMAWAIVQKESNARPYAHNDNPNTGDNSYGLFQINMYRGLEESRQKAYNLSSNEDLFDAKTNAEIAYKISRGGTSWGAWTTRDSAISLLQNYND